MEEDDLLFPDAWPSTTPVADAAETLPASSTASPTAPLLPRFCGVCGSAWNALLAECAICSQLKQLPPPALPDQRRPVVWGLSFYFMFLFVSVVAIIVSATGVSEFNVQAIAEAADSILVIVWTIILWQWVAPSLRAKFNPAWIIAAAGGGVITFFIANTLLNFIHKMLHVRLLQYSPPFLAAGYGLPMILLCVCIQPAVIEELAFRGIIFGCMNRALSGSETIIVSALLFMTMHLSPISFPHLFLLGAAVGFLRFRSGSIIPGAFLHFTHNLLCIAGEHWNWMNHVG